MLENTVVRKFRRTALDSKFYETKHYNLDVIISEGYRVKPKQGTQATQRLKEYIEHLHVKGDQ